jgi:hypothetical protein
VLEAIEWWIVHDGASCEFEDFVQQLNENCGDFYSQELINFINNFPSSNCV